MPDTKITWSSLREHLRKYVWVYVVGIAVCLAITSLLWTTTAPRIPDDQSVIIYLMDTASNVDPLDDVARDMLARGQADDETLRLVEFQSLQYQADDYVSSMLLLTRMSVSEGDAYLASQAGIDALTNAQALMPLDDAVAAGWLSQYGLAPYYVPVRDEEGEETGETYLAALRLDTVDALMERSAFNNEGAFLCLSAASTNPDTVMRTLDIMLEDLTKGDAHAAAEGTEPAA